MRSENLNHYLVALFYICWIFLGNFILLNLFLAILLDSFLEEDEEEESEEAKAESKRIKTLKKLEKKKKEQMNKVIMFYPSQAKKNAAAEFFNSNQKQEEHEDLEDLDEEQTLSIFKDEGLIEKS